MVDIKSDSFRAIVPYQGLTTFWRTEATRDIDQADIAVYGIPLDLGTVNRPGARLGPRAIREQMTLTGALGDIWPHGFDLREKLKIIDYGDLSFMPGYIDDMLAVADEHLSRLADAGVATLGLGGDHLIAYPEIKALARVHGPLSLIHFDAHTDCFESERLNHGSMFWFAAKEGLVDPTRSIQIGIRTPIPEESQFTVLTALECQRMASTEIIDRVRNLVGNRPCFISVDVDGMDPAYTPGTGTPVPGGLSSGMQREILWGLKGLNTLGCDVVEVSPPYDQNGVTAIVASYIAADLLHVLGANRLQSHA